MSFEAPQTPPPPRDDEVLYNEANFNKLSSSQQQFFKEEIEPLLKNAEALQKSDKQHFLNTAILWMLEGDSEVPIDEIPERLVKLVKQEIGVDLAL